VVVWRPIMRQNSRNRRNALVLGTRFNAWQEPLNRFGPNSHGRRVWSFARTSFNVKVKGQRSRSPGTKNALCTHDTPAVWTEWNALDAHNVAQAAGAPIRSHQWGVFTGMRALGLAGYRWALPHISSFFYLSTLSFTIHLFVALDSL